MTNWKKHVSKLTKEFSNPNEEISKDDLNKIINKIREEYTEYAPLHPTGFKLLEFEARYTQVLKEKGDLKKFLLTEIEFLEKMKTLYSSQKKKAEIIKNSPINKILDEQESLYTHFPKIDFHPYGRREIKFFYGAVKQFVEKDLYILSLLFKGTLEMNELKDCITMIEKMGKVFRSSPSIRITEHILNINARSGDPDFIEKDSQLIIKDTCISLKTLDDTLQKLMEENRISQQLTLSFPYNPQKEDLEEFRGKSYLECSQKISFSCKSIISAFRMDWLYLSKKP